MPARMLRLSEAEGLALVRTGLRLLRRWSASDAQTRAILGGLSPEQHAAWKREKVGTLTPDKIYRLALLLEIHKATRLRLGTTENATGWMRRPNAGFVEQSPVELIATGELAAIERLLAYLVADLSPW